MPSTTPQRTLTSTLLLAPLFALYGVFVFLWALVRFPRRLAQVRTALAADLRCPNGHRSETRGRFECAACHATYHGWVGRCGVCGAGASWTACGTCGVAIPLPWERS